MKPLFNEGQRVPTHPLQCPAELDSDEGATSDGLFNEQAVVARFFSRAFATLIILFDVGGHVQTHIVWVAMT